MKCKPSKKRRNRIKVTCVVRLKAAAAGRIRARLSRSGRIVARGGARASARVLRLGARHRLRRGGYLLTMRISTAGRDDLVIRQRVAVR